MTTDDIHDLFDNEGADESDGSEAGPEPESESDDSEGSSEWNEFPLREDGESVEPADAAREETAEPVGTGSGGPVEDDSGDPEMDWSSTSPETAVVDDADGIEPTESTTFFEDPAEDDPGEAEPVESTSSSDDAPAEVRGESESGESATASSADVTAKDPREPERTASTGEAPHETVVDDADEADPGASSTAPTQESIEHDADDSRSNAATTSTEQLEVDATEDDSSEVESTGSGTVTSGRATPEDVGEPPTESTASATEAVPEEDVDGTESIEEPVAPRDASAEERAEATSAGATTSSDRAIRDDRGAPAAAEVTTTTDGPVADDLDAPDDSNGSTTTGRDGPGSTASGTATGDEAATTQSGSSRLPTGIDVLDRAMGGGIPPGRLVLLVADPGVQSELIVDSILSQRDTLYVTTDRPDWEVMKDIEPGIGSGEVNIREHTPDSLLSGVDLLLDELGTSSNFVLDSVNELELVPRQRYRIFLSDVKQRLFETGSLGLLTGVTVGHESARDLTLRRADIVLQLETRTTDHEIENRLSVPKFRGGAAMTETVKLELTDEVRVATDGNRG